MYPGGGVLHVSPRLSTCGRSFGDGLQKSDQVLLNLTRVGISGRPGSGQDDLHPGRNRDRDRDRNETPAGTGISLIRPGPGPGFFQYFSISVKMKQCYNMLNKIFQNKLSYVNLKLTVNGSNYSINISGMSTRDHIITQPGPLLDKPL